MFKTFLCKIDNKQHIQLVYIQSALQMSSARKFTEKYQFISTYYQNVFVMDKIDLNVPNHVDPGFYNLHTRSRFQEIVETPSLSRTPVHWPSE